MGVSAGPTSCGSLFIGGDFLMNDVYYDPNSYDLETIGEIDWSTGSYEFDLTVVWRCNNTFYYGEDASCSCSSPFENQGINDLNVITSLANFKEHLDSRNRGNCDGDRTIKITELLERMHSAGMR